MTQRILTPDTALIPVDVQKAFDFPPYSMTDLGGMERNGRRLLAAWRTAGAPVLHVRHDSVEPGSPLQPGHPGHAFRDGFSPLAGEPVVSKSVNAAFIGTDLDLRLRRLGVRRIVLFGLTTDMCVSTTARVGANLGYAVWVVGDACATFAQPDSDGEMVPAAAMQRAHLATLNTEFARVVTTASVLMERTASPA